MGREKGLEGFMWQGRQDGHATRLEEMRNTHKILTTDLIAWQDNIKIILNKGDVWV
jgi:hypothetical protein